MLRIAPAGLMRGDIGFGALLETHRLGSVELSFLPIGFASLDRIEALQTRSPAVLRPLPSLGQTDRVQRSEPHLPQPAGFSKSKDPGFRPARPDQQIKPAAVAVIAPRGCARDIQRLQLPDDPRHPPNSS